MDGSNAPGSSGRPSFHARRWVARAQESNVWTAFAPMLRGRLAAEDGPLGPVPSGPVALRVRLAASLGSSQTSPSDGGREMYTEYLVADFMTIDPIVTSPDARMEDVERLLDAYGISGLPVIEDGGRLVGVITQTDLLRGGGDVHGAIRKRYSGLRVADLMTSPAATVEITTPLCEA